MVIRPMEEQDWSSVSEIYGQGMAEGTSTFQTEIPDYKLWNEGHLKSCRLVAVDESNRILGWAALSPISSRCAYNGVAEISIYIHKDYRGKHIGTDLLHTIIRKSKEEQIWTLQSAIFAINIPSIAVHKKAGFRVVGTREKIAKDRFGVWQDVILLERRIKTAEDDDRMEKTEYAEKLFRSGYNCSQAVLGAFCEKYGLPLKDALKLASGFGGGMRNGEVCGAVTGALMVIGLKYGQYDNTDTSSKNECYEKTIEFTKQFKDKNQSIVCREILHCNISTDEGKKEAIEKNLFMSTCIDMIKSSVEILNILGY